MNRAEKPIKTKSLQWQILFRFFLLFFMILVILEIFQYITMKQYLFKGKEQILISRIHNADRYDLDDIDTQDKLSDKSQSLINSMFDSDVSIAVINKDGKIINQSSTNGMEQDDAFVPKLSQDTYKKLMKQSGDLNFYKLIKFGDDREYMVMWSKVGDSDSSTGLIQLSTSTKQIRDILKKQILTYIIISISALLIGGILGRKVLKRTLKPLYNMTETMEKITVGELNTRLPEYNNQMEINRLSRAFNKMLERIEVSFKKEQQIKEKMRQFISDASHELRTPLTSIHGFAEVLLRGAAKNEKQLNQALNSILIESDRLTKLVNDLLTLTRLEQKAAVEMRIENISDIVKEVYPQLQMIASERKLELLLEDKVLIFANRNQLKQIVFNLVHNSVQHTDEKNGIIKIFVETVKRDGESAAAIKITDNGTGIPEEHLGEIFDRFFRSESHRSRKHGGYGLGLSIVKSIVDAHEGKIEVNSIPGEETEFIVYFKKAE